MPLYSFVWSRQSAGTIESVESQPSARALSLDHWRVSTRVFIDLQLSSRMVGKPHSPGGGRATPPSIGPKSGGSALLHVCGQGEQSCRISTVAGIRVVSPLAPWLPWW